MLSNDGRGCRGLVDVERAGGVDRDLFTDHTRVGPIRLGKRRLVGGAVRIVQVVEHVTVVAQPDGVADGPVFVGVGGFVKITGTNTSPIYLQPISA